jgi:hypothetical protein
MVRVFICRTAGAEEILERILDERKTMFPYTDEQAQRFMQVYRDLKSCESRRCCTVSCSKLISAKPHLMATRDTIAYSQRSPGTFRALCSRSRLSASGTTMGRRRHGCIAISPSNAGRGATVSKTCCSSACSSTPTGRTRTGWRARDPKDTSTSPIFGS